MGTDAADWDATNAPAGPRWTAIYSFPSPTRTGHAQIWSMLADATELVRHMTMQGPKRIAQLVADKAVTIDG